MRNSDVRNELMRSAREQGTQYPFFKNLSNLFILITFILSIVNINPVNAVPSYARQTGMACAACHNSFPELNAFGRQFKLNGYTLSTLKNIEATDDKEKVKLSLSPLSPLSAMVMTSFTHMGEKLPGSQNDNVEFPQQLSLFYAGQITPHIGTFIQITYTAQDGAISLDNTDIRYSNHIALGEKDWTYGFTLNNNPTVQDVWNTVPAWSYPYSTSGTVPHPAAATLIEGGLGGQVAGLGTYGLFNNLLYYEFTVYRSAPQGAHNPPDSTSAMVLKGVSPYWRLALQHQFGSHYFMIGTYGMSSNIYPTAPSGLYDKYMDLGFDLQYEHTMANSSITIHSSLIQEKKTLNATLFGNTNLSPKLTSFKVDGNLTFQKGFGFTLGYFNIMGDADAILYPTSGINGSLNNKPNSNGMLAELSYLPWYNTKLSLQYVKYSKFNGGGDNYDGSGRNASQNNNLYLLLWISF
jgi:hypothetical protein